MLRLIEHTLLDRLSDLTIFSVLRSQSILQQWWPVYGWIIICNRENCSSFYTEYITADRADSGGYTRCQHTARHYHHWYWVGGVSRTETESVKASYRERPLCPHIDAAANIPGVVPKWARNCLIKWLWSKKPISLATCAAPIPLASSPLARIRRICVRY